MKTKVHKTINQTNPETLSFKSHETLSLGCINCLDKDDCGGNHSSPGIFDCEIFCQCEDSSVCPVVCPNNDSYISNIHDIRGWKLDNISRSKVIPYPELPLVVPYIYHKYIRSENLSVETVAVPLKELFSQNTGEIKFHSKKALAEKFRFDERAKLIIVGIDDDPFIESYWTHRRATELPESIARLQPDLIMSPNYSLPSDVPRQDNLHSIKRIAIIWNEFVLAGIPTSLHINARTDKDWERWTKFIKEREEIKYISFEYATGGAINEQGNYYTNELIKLAKSIDRELSIIVKGGKRYVKKLFNAYDNFVFLDSTSFMKTVKRRSLIWQPGDKMTDRRCKTEKDEPLDFLLERNIELMAKMIEYEAFGHYPPMNIMIATGRYS